ncbi:MAG: hypothetical protein Q4C96_03690 [Planctomycetia bacterium]|nr:hypothetical protein [Planctomycetia bacterium]
MNVIHFRKSVTKPGEEGGREGRNAVHKFTFRTTFDSFIWNALKSQVEPG